MGDACEPGHHKGASPSHAEGAWCNACAGFAHLGHFEASDWPEALVPYLIDLRGIGDVLKRGEIYKTALIKIAAWEGPGNSQNRVLACRALGVEPENHCSWIDFPPDPRGRT